MPEDTSEFGASINVAPRAENSGNKETDDDTPVSSPYDPTPENKNRVSERIDKRLGVDKFTRSQFERAWFRNIAFRAGQQDIIYDQGRFRIKQLPPWYPKVQTNKFGEKARDLISAILTGRVPIKYFPATDNPEDQGTADVGERVREVVYTEAKIDDKELELANWFILTGNAFLIPYYDYDKKFGEMSAPKLECPTCGKTFGAQDLEDAGVDENAPMCPNCAQTTGVQSPLVPSTETELLPIGSLCADPCSPFEIRADSRIRNYRDWTWYIRQRRYDVSLMKEKYNYEGGPEDRDEPGGSLSQHYLDILAQINNTFDPQFTVMGNTSGSSKMPKVTVYEYYQLPDDDFPEGLRAVRIGSGVQNVVEMGPLPTEYGAGVRKGQKFLNIIHFRAEEIPGRLWGSTPLDDAIPLQLFRNVVERVIKLETQRMANSIWLDPKGSNVQLYNGEPGWICKYNPMTLGGTTPIKPERLAPQLQHLAMLIELLKYIDDSIERVTGTFFLQGGDAPSGVTAASALALLDERAKKAMSPLVRQWAKAFLAFDEIALELARQNWTDGRIRVIAGRNKKWQTSSFMAADLQGAVNMEIDYQSMFPKSNATERAEIQQLVQGGILSGQDPQEKVQILKKFGLMSMMGSLDIDIEEAQKENAGFMKMGEKALELVPLVQNSLIHFIEHCDFCKTDEFKELPPDQKQMMYAHIQAHAVDMGERRALFAEMQLNPDAPEAMEIGTGAAQAALQGAGQVMGPGATAGNAAGSMTPGAGGPPRPGKPKGTTGNGPNQDQAQAARAAQPIPDVGAGVFPTQ